MTSLTAEVGMMSKIGSHNLTQVGSSTALELLSVIRIPT